MADPLECAKRFQRAKFMFYTYVLLCKANQIKNTLYTGYTDNLRKRVKKHLQKEVKTTRKFATTKLIYYEACLSKTDARKRENQLKTGFGRGYLKRRLDTYLKKRD